MEIAERAFNEGWVSPVRGEPTGRRSRSSARDLRGSPRPSSSTRAGHAVTVFERAEAPGGLLRYGIPEFKLEKWVLDRGSRR